MTAEILIISGFLGAGKTTLLQKMLKETFQDEKVVLIENDFGEISVDAALLKTSGVEVKEMNSGCICCSLSGDFVKSVKEIAERFHPDRIIIEPSGVGKLSDIIKACQDPSVQKVAALGGVITVADVKRCNMYLNNFGEFYEDQIKYAQVIVLSRTDDYPNHVHDAQTLIKSLNADCAILSNPWDQIGSDEILYLCHTQKEHVHHSHSHECECHLHHEHNHGEHGGCCSHSAEEAFDMVTIRTSRIFSVEKLNSCSSKLEDASYGTVLRMKGIVRGENGTINVQYLPGNLQATECAAEGGLLCIIGRNLHKQELIELFGEE